MLVVSRRWLGCAAVVMALGAYVNGASAQTYPSQSVKLLVGFAPGGPADIIARIVGQKLSEHWRQPVVIENRGGAGGNIAAVQAAKAEPNGSTILVTTSAFAVNPSLSSKAGYSPDEFRVAVIAATTPNLIVGAPNLPFATLADAIKAAKAQPMTYGTAGIGTTPHLSAEKIFSIVAKVPILHTPFTGAGPALNSVVGGHTPLASVALPAAVELVKGGQVKALAVTSNERIAALPDVPTAREQGLADDEDATWVAFFLPAKTPSAIVEKINADVNAVVSDKEVQQQLGKIGFRAVGGGVEQANRYVKSEIVKWGDVIGKLGLKLDQ
ncbi:Bug family tripartite tricarboxylate transporter substrate binding protein [Bradyrhizobium prioriisuperbiae]|uniref:Bug family tripartite tricarboxylate transporter substrate binding protein n=1 Tax=Bradyrhizobium prioriisuperbiae TaxID=2854389 RepID=UPI0028EADF8D|nr:tripartite tricarboxylate transporter substrate-binding protein [Bradyrhizobium prioritasuperba]